MILRSKDCLQLINLVAQLNLLLVDVILMGNELTHFHPTKEPECHKGKRAYTEAGPEHDFRNRIHQSCLPHFRAIRSCSCI